MRPTLMALEDRRLLSTFTVTSTLDDGSVGTLRWAVGQANSAGGAETIAFDKTVFKTPQTITLAGTQLELSDTTGTETITGPKAGVTVSGGGLSRVFQVDGGVTASISGLTITGGRPPQQRRRAVQRRRHGHADRLHRQRKLRRQGGGGLDSHGTTTLTNCTVSGNSAVRLRRRRCTTRRHGDADQLHRQRQLRRQRRRPVQQRHGHADQLHHQRKLRRHRGGGMYNLAARPR